MDLEYVSTSLMVMSYLCLIVCLHFCYSTITSHIILRLVLLIQVSLHIPHKGFETVTFSFSGSIGHKDAAGNSGVIHSGDVQWMTAASGVLHKEFHEKEYAKRGRLFHALQLWINLPERHKNDAPSYQYIPATIMGRYQSLDETIDAIVYTGTFRHITGPAKSHTLMNIYKLKLQPNSWISILRYDLEYRLPCD